MGIQYSSIGKYEKAIEYFLDALNIYEEFNNSPHKATARTGMNGLANTYGSIGNVLWRQGIYERAIEYYFKSYKMYEELGNKVGISNCLMNIGNIHLSKGSFDKADELFHNALAFYIELNNKEGISNCYNNIGIVYWKKGSLSDALEYYLKALNTYEEIGNKRGMANGYLNVGNILKDQEDYDNAIKYFQQSQKLFEEIGDKNGVSKCYNNIGNVYNIKALKSSNPKERISSCNIAIEYFLEAKKIKEEQGDKKGMSISYANIGNLYLAIGSYDEAISYFQKSLKIELELGDKSGVSIICNGLAKVNIELADTAALSENQRLNYLKKAIEYGNKSFNLALEIKSIPIENDASFILMRAYRKLGNLSKALEFADIFKATRDSLYKEEKNIAITKMQTKYETEKKQQEIENQQLLIEKQELLIEKQEIDNKRQKYLRNFLIASFLILSLFALYVLRGYKQKKRINAIVTEKNVMLENANAEISAQRDLVISQKDKIEEVNRNITDSIRYARSIQAAILPSESVLKQISIDSFILMKPCELVSGDFFWATTVNDYHIFCASDCTGHGVPGAFMSILGISALNEIVVKQRIVKPSQILGYLRDNVIEALSHNDPEQLHKDGMDMALCSLNIKTRELQFAGAGLPLWLVVDEHSNIIENESNALKKNGLTIHEIKGDIMPVGASPLMKPFANNTLHLAESNVIIYLATDGFSDQFGGPHGKKYKATNLKNLLLDICRLPLQQQQILLETALDEWQGSRKQVDDVTILGIKV